MKVQRGRSSFDVTLLWNYDFEDKATNFNFDPTINATWVTQHLFVKVPGMPGLLRDLKSRGYALYGITGRPAAQEADTIANLNEQGFTVNGQPAGTPLFTAATMYTKDPVVAGPPASIPTQPWVDCAADGNPAACSTVEYKALTRDHIETADGVDLLMNVGDQWSDLQGGFADDVDQDPEPDLLPGLARPRDCTDERRLDGAADVVRHAAGRLQRLLRCHR